MKDNISQFHISAMCRVLAVSTSGFYGWLKDAGGVRGREDEALSEIIKKAFEDSRGAYGSRRIRRGLQRLEKGCTLWRIHRLIHHSGRGVQYACGDYQKVIKRAGM